MSAVYRATTVCRICASDQLERIIDLGDQALTGIFPKSRDVDVPSGPLALVRCTKGCGLVQLAHTYEPTTMYGGDYGYRSGLNRSMVEHLGAKVKRLLTRRAVSAGDVVLDIGSNDGTTLSFYPDDAQRIGIDPTSDKFAKYYKPGIRRVADFFSASAFRTMSDKPAKIVTSIAMFYDLERPMDFARDVHEVLEDGGLWHFEQSYIPMMLAATSYDTICHEHVEYYALGQIRWMMDRVGFSIVDVELNDINGGSFAVTVAKSKPGATEHAPIVHEMLAKEAPLAQASTYADFAGATSRHRDELRKTLEDLKKSGKRVFGMGASTKGNVVLQYCGIGPELLACIAEVNEDKFGAFTPGTKIPIISEQEALAQKPDVLMVLPWHFRANIVRRAQPIFDRGIQLLFPLPKIEFVSKA